jgi:hypothetical protein
MLYNNICIKVPKTPKPASVSLTPNVKASLFLELVADALEPVEVPVALVASAVVLQV